MNSEHTIYMDYQASTPLRENVLEAMLPYLTHDYGNPHSSDHVMGWKASKAVDDSRQKVAEVIGAQHNEIIFTSGATESNNQAIISVARSLRHANKKILVGATEHKCVIEAARFASNEYGLGFDIIPVNKEGFINIEAYKIHLEQGVGIVSIMIANNEIGTIQDIKLLAKLAKQYGAVFHCDAAQGLMASDIDVTDLGVDLMSLSAHKIYGPKGIGALYLSNDLSDMLEPIIYGGSQQNGLRAGTIPTSQCVGFGVACDSLENIDAERNRLRALKAHFISLLSNKIELEINGPKDYMRCHPGNINVYFPSIDAHSLLMMLQPKICASTGSACNSGNIESSYVIKALGCDAKRAESSIRFSIGLKTTMDEITQAAELITQTIEMNSL